MWMRNNTKNKLFIKNRLVRKFVGIYCVTLIIFISLIPLISVPIKSGFIEEGEGGGTSITDVGQTEPIISTVSIVDSSGTTTMVVEVGATETLWLEVEYAGAIDDLDAYIYIDEYPPNEMNIILSSDIIQFEYNYVPALEDVGQLTYYFEIYNETGVSVYVSDTYNLTVEITPVTPSDSTPTPDLIEPPEIIDTSGDVTVNAGETVTIWVTTTIDVVEADVLIDNNEEYSMVENSASSRWEYDYVVDNSNHFYTITVYSDQLSLVGDQQLSATSSSYNIIILDLDEDGPIISIRNPDAGSSIYDRTPSITAVYDDPSGIDTSSITLKIDDEVVYPQIKRSNRVVYTPSTEMNEGEHTVFLEILDLYGNSKTIQWTFIILPDEDKSEDYLWDVPSGQNEEVLLGNSDETSVTNIGIRTVSNLKDVKATVYKLEQKPDDIPEPPIQDGKIYKYLDMKVLAEEDGEDIYVPEDVFESVRIRFKVEKTWIKENNIDKNSITLMRYHDGEWQYLATSIIYSGNDFVYLIALTPGFSTFAVVGSTQVMSSDTYAPETADIPLELIIGIIVAIGSILVIFLFKARYIYFGEEHASTEPKKKIKRKIR